MFAGGEFVVSQLPLQAIVFTDFRQCGELWELSSTQPAPGWRMPLFSLNFHRLEVNSPNSPFFL